MTATEDVTRASYNRGRQRKRGLQASVYGCEFRKARVVRVPAVAAAPIGRWGDGAMMQAVRTGPICARCGLDLRASCVPVAHEPQPLLR